MKILEQHSNNLRKAGYLLTLFLITLWAVVQVLSVIEINHAGFKILSAAISLVAIYPLVSRLTDIVTTLKLSKTQLCQMYADKYVWFYVVPFKNQSYTDDDDSGGGTPARYAYAKIVKD